MYCNYSTYLLGYQSCSYQNFSRALFLPMNFAKLLAFLLTSIFLSPLLLLSSFSVQALSVYTSQTIEGSAPYLTFDGGRTRVTSTESLLAIELPDGTTLTPSTNPSSSTNPIRLPYAGSTLGDIDMLIPSSVNSVDLSDLVTRYNYWGDDDGDGQGSGGVTASGSISVSFTDKDSNTVSRSDALDKCKAPYKVTLSSVGGYLQTQYGVPNRTSFSGAMVDYYINPYDSSPSVCYARPNLLLGGTTGINSNDEPRYAGPANIWSPTKGFLTQSNDSSSYGRNFPTTGANGLYFDLLIGGVDASQLTWSPVTRGGITATVTSVIAYNNWLPSVDRGKVVARVKLSGPRAISTQINSNNPSPLTPLPSLPQTFELVGRDSRGNEVRYGFVLKQWFVNRGSKLDTQSNQSTWCSSLGYRLASVSDLTNAVKTDSPSISGALPSSSDNYYMRHIGAGFFTEWGYMTYSADAGFVPGAIDWTSDTTGRNVFSVNSNNGHVGSGYVYYSGYAVCTAP
ncbi:hypothetical protein GA0061081_10833 [Gilliamella bombicola]|uniref:Uncharacterized protein n=1 Tax=Gilliamella bombicola TaxID=1798182 RepID=A0A1C4CC61_9GAMM|nr:MULTISPECIES: hypothetical protein [Gilliamella]NUF28225.1 hypothetical protein [Gilliamella sp. ESL0254]SCC16632.1 hypothetical protein GA0061081_10833 [Gilliamella bombicola]